MDTWFVKSLDLCYELISLPSIASKNKVSAHQFDIIFGGFSIQLIYYVTKG